MATGKVIRKTSRKAVQDTKTVEARLEALERENADLRTKLSRKSPEFEPVCHIGEWNGKPTVALQTRPGERIGRWNSVQHTVSVWRGILANADLLAKACDQAE